MTDCIINNAEITSITDFNINKNYIVKVREDITQTIFLCCGFPKIMDSPGLDAS